MWGTWQDVTSFTLFVPVVTQINEKTLASWQAPDPGIPLTYPIRFITIGRPKLEPVRELEQHYQGLLKAYARLTVTELGEGRGDRARQLKEEAERIRPHFQGVRCPVLLSAEGPARTSEAFARWLGERMDRGTAWPSPWAPATALIPPSRPKSGST